MILFDGALALFAFAVWIFCIIDVITTPEAECRNLPKFAWLALVILLLDVGSIIWLVAGRNWTGSAAARAPRRAPARARRQVPLSPDDDEEFLAKLRARAEEQRRRAREATDEDPPTA